MNIEDLRDYCIAKPGVSECFPFDEDTLVFKVAEKMFLLTSLSARPVSFNVKCEPNEAVLLREKYNCVAPGYHMNKKHWNTITINSDIDTRLVKQWIDNSYNLVIRSLPKKKRLLLATQ